MSDLFQVLVGKDPTTIIAFLSLVIYGNNRIRKVQSKINKEVTEKIKEEIQKNRELEDTKFDALSELVKTEIDHLKELISDLKAASSP